MFNKTLAPIGVISAITLLALTGCGSGDNDKASNNNATATQSATDGTGGNPGSDISSSSEQTYDFSYNITPGSIVGESVKLQVPDGLAQVAKDDDDVINTASAITLKGHKMNKSSTCAIDMDIQQSDDSQAKDRVNKYIEAFSKDPSNAQASDKNLTAKGQMFVSLTEAEPMSSFNEDIDSKTNNHFYLNDDATKGIFVMDCAESESEDPDDLTSSTMLTLDLPFIDSENAVDSVVSAQVIPMKNGTVSVIGHKTYHYKADTSGNWISK